MIRRKRRREGKTDYKARVAMLKSEKTRIVFRSSNRYIIGQLVDSEIGQDKVILEINSKKLLNYGWPKESVSSLNSLPATYLTGYLLAKKSKVEESIFDIGLIRNVPKNRSFAFLKGIVDGGIKVNSNEKMFPSDERIKGEHLKNKINFVKVQKNIEEENA